MNCITARCEHCKCRKIEMPDNKIFKSMLDVYCDLGHNCITVFSDRHEPLKCWDYKERERLEREG